MLGYEERECKLKQSFWKTVWYYFAIPFCRNSYTRKERDTYKKNQHGIVPIIPKLETEMSKDRWMIK